MNALSHRPNACWAPAQLLVLLACCTASGAFADVAGGKLQGWQLEQGVDNPSYAWIEPTRTNLNIDTVVLVCEGTNDNRVLQLQLYLAGEGPLRPKGAGRKQLKAEPRAEILIDGRRFGADILFADEYAVLADGQQGLFPTLSDAVLDAMQTGKTMVLRFDLIAERPGRAATFDSEAVIDLQSGIGATAISTVRRCAGRVGDLPVYTALPRH